ncbi:FAD-dependent oxidoreductase [Vineibacter terrae]|uniref:FAD-dependent oxidoreductase n=1 Tax=Vineibacter terrae TaxID=2586908 RepID=UPI002E35DE8E|nr:FAD-dependent oxidoreductase [Vineibacter terrae]HEX2889886.1 FAD-dependent oxidoreductase [Vineibacter terrae]
MRTVDVVVVGGGIAGLVAAAFASKAGAGVLLLEASPAFGGRARTRIVSGYHFNQGAHALYRGGFVDKALQDLGVEVTGNVPALADGFFVNDNKLHQAPFSAAGLASTTLLSDAEKSEIALLFRRLRDGSTQTPPGTSLNDALAALSQSPKVRAVLAAMVRLTSIVHAPIAADGLALLDQLRGGLARSALYLDGGWATMVEGLRSACAALGACLRPGARVEGIEHGPPWCATLADGTAVTARAVILAVAPAQAAVLYPALKDLRGTIDAVPAKVACLDIGLAHLPRPDVRFALGVDRPLYFSVHSAAARLAPEGAALVHTMRYLEPGETLDRDRLIAELEAYMDLVQPGWREVERARQFLPAMPVISAIPLAATNGLHGRPDIAAGNAEGLFICGDWVGPVGLLSDAAAASGRSAGEAAALFAQH